jgi:hypothetical protein
MKMGQWKGEMRRDKGERSTDREHERRNKGLAEPLDRMSFALVALDGQLVC